MWEKLWNTGGNQELAVMVGQWQNFNNKSGDQKKHEKCLG